MGTVSGWWVSPAWIGGWGHWEEQGAPRTGLPDLWEVRCRGGGAQVEVEQGLEAARMIGWEQEALRSIWDKAVI